MYKTKALSEAGWLVNSNTDGFSYTMDRKKRFGTTPVGVLSSALSGCVTMCVRGYCIVNKFDGIVIETEVDTNVDDFTIEVRININKDVENDEVNKIVEYVKDKCTVSQMLSSDIKISYFVNNIQY
ncbi:OsmC family protein [Pseudostreptobacillus sp.]|jgi:hypothetical protein